MYIIVLIFPYEELFTDLLNELYNINHCIFRGSYLTWLGVTRLEYACTVTSYHLLLLFSPFRTAGICDEAFYTAPGFFSSPNYPENYPDSSFCRTRIFTEPGNRILFALRDFELEPDFSPACTANFDTLSIYDSVDENSGNLLARLCGDDPSETAFISTATSMSVVFKSDGSVNRRGFDAVFYAVPGE